MKFIREIIGEKRQMEGEAAQDTVTEAPVVEVPVTERSVTGPSATEPSVTEPFVAETSAAPTQPAHTDVTDEIAAFFAKDDEGVFMPEAAVEIVDGPVAEAASEPAPEPEAAPVAEQAPQAQTAERKPTKLVLGKPMTVPTSASETAAPEADAPKADATPNTPADIDRVLVSDHTPDQTLSNVMQAASDQADTAQSAQPAEPFAASAPVNAPVVQPEAAPVAEAPVAVPPPAVGRGRGGHGRVKTRLLGFNTDMGNDADPMAEKDEASAAPCTQFPVGWLMVVEGQGRGSAFTLFHGVSTIGRGADQTIRLDFGDNSISRENHASIAYDPRQKSFYVGHGGKANIVRRNDRPVLSTEELSAGDLIDVGETTLRFVPLCGPDFSWEDQTQNAGRAHASLN